MLNQTEFEELARTREQGCVSIYMPTHRRGRDVREDPIRLDNLLKEAEEHAATAGLAPQSVQANLRPARALLHDTLFWRHQANGLALFALDGSLRHYSLPHSVDELVVAGERFCVRPLLPFIDAGQRFFVLALSQNRARLLECSQQGVRELDLHDIPRSLTDALGDDWEQRSLQFHTGAPNRAGGSDAMFHGQGRGTDESKEEIQKFLRIVDAGVCALLRTRTQKAPLAPLVLAAVGYVDSIYRQVSDYPQLIKRGIEGNPDEAEPADLQQKALSIVAPFLSREVDEQLALLENTEHTPRATTNLATVLTAARDARVEALFVATDATLWGIFDGTTGDVEVHDERRAQDADLLDLAVALGLASGARVFGVRSEDLPGGSLIGSMLRYGV
jgi:hypothetical protein